MKRDYTDGVKDDVSFFTGFEVETTPAHGFLTLFVVGFHPVETILQLYREHNCEHIYMGANQSFEVTFDSNGGVQFSKWQPIIKELLDNDILVTLDFDLKYIEYVQASGLCEYSNFIPQISVKIPNIKKLNYNTTLKIDDVDFKSTNPGVWCHRLHDLQAIDKFTSWHEYRKDESI